MSIETKYTIVKLNNANYFVWKFKMQLLLTKEGVWENIVADPPNPLTDAWSKKDSTAYATIGLNVEDDQFVHIRGTSSGRSAWEALRTYHERSNANSLVRLIKRLMNMKLDEGADLEMHITRVAEAFQQLHDIGKELKSDDWHTAVLLASLPKSYDTLVTTLESRETELNTAVVEQRLLDEWKKRKDKNPGHADGTVLRVSTNANINSQTEISCYFCKEKGHYKSKCPKYKRYVNNKKEKEKGSANKQHAKLVDASQDNEFLFLTSKLQHGWIIDSGATSHVTSDRNVFSELNVNHQEKIYMANGQRIAVEGIGTVRINAVNNNGKSVSIKMQEVLYVPSINGSLLSVRKLVEKGFKVNFTPNGQCNIMQRDIVAATAELRGNLYVLKEANRALLTTNEVHPKDCVHQWHARCGHRDLEVVKRLNIDGHVKGANIVSCPIKVTCEVCTKGKMTRVPFPRTSEKSSRKVMDLVHTDVCGPMQTKTPSGNRYVLTFIDDYTRFTTVYLLQNKSDVFDKLKEYIKLVQTMFMKPPKIIRSDRGTEYTDSRVVKYLKDEDTQIQYTTAYSPQQNGIAERKNRTLVEMARCMIIESKLDNSFWGEAVLTPNYIQNRLPWKSIKVTPYEGWFGKKPNIRHFKSFGSKCYVYIHKEKRQKLDPKAILTILVGYDENSKAYKCYNSSTQKVIISRDVTFPIQEEISEISATIEPQDIEVNVTPNKHQDNQQETTEDINEDENPDESTYYSGCSDTEVTNTVPLRRSERSTKGVPAQRLINEINIIHGEVKEPKNYNEAIRSPFKNQWIKAMEEEMASLKDNKIWELSELPKNKKAIGCKWIYKIKREANGSIRRFKARLVAQG